MMPSSPVDAHEVFESRVLVVAEFVRSCGVSFIKDSESSHVVFSGNGRTVSFPVTSDLKDWLIATPEESLFACLREAAGWMSARLIETVDMDATYVDILRERDATYERRSELAAVLGGPSFADHLFALPGLEG